MIPEAVRRAVILACLFLCRPARAELHEWKISVTPGYAIGYVDSRTANGGGGGVEVGFGITEALTLHASAFLSWHDLDKSMTQQAGVMTGYASMIGLTYSLDVIRLVPSFDIQVGAVGVRGNASFGDEPKVLKSSDDFAIAVGFGIDYLLTRHVALGFLVRYHALLTDITRIPVYLYLGPRISFRFGG